MSVGESMKKNINFLGKTFDVTENKSDRILYYKVKIGDALYSCSRAYSLELEKDEAYIDDEYFSSEGNACYVSANAGTQLNKNEVYLTCTTEEYGIKTVSTIVFADVTHLEAALNEMTAGKGNPIAYFNRHDIKLTPISFIRYKFSDGKVLEPAVVINDPTLNYDEIAQKMGFKRYMIDMIDMKEQVINFTENALNNGNPDNIQGLDELAAAEEADLVPSKLCSPNTSIMYQMIKQNAKKMENVETTGQK